MRGSMLVLRNGAVATLAAALLGIPFASRAAEPAPVEINAVLATTGAFALNGREGVRSLTVAENLVNKTGGIRGRPVKFVISDDQTNPQVAVQIVTDLLARNVPVMLGPSPVAACNAAAPLVREHAVMFCASSAYHPPANSDLYVAGVSTLEQMLFSVRYLRQHGMTKIASITSADANGADTDNGIAAALARPENKGVTLVAAEHFSLSDINVDAQIARIKASGAQAIITGNNGTPLGVVFHGYTDLGLSVPIVMTSGALNYETVNRFGAILPKQLLFTGQPSDAPDAVTNRAQAAAVRSFVDAFKAAGIEPDHAHAVIWDPAMIVVAALRKLGPSANAQQINAFIHNLHGWYGAAGTYDFRDGNQSGLTSESLVMLRWDPDRKVFSAVSKLGRS